MTIKLKIEKKYISYYLDSKSCPITKALQKAGYNLEHWGITTRNSKGEIVLYNDTHKGLNKLTSIVRDMYIGNIAHEDFEFNLIVKKELNEYKISVPHIS